METTVPNDVYYYSSLKFDIYLPIEKTAARMLRFLAPLVLSALALTSNAIAGHPRAHILICCRGSNNGTTFEGNGKWNPRHS